LGDIPNTTIGGFEDAIINIPNGATFKTSSSDTEDTKTICDGGVK
jgi:hypothetical protein